MPRNGEGEQLRRSRIGIQELLQLSAGPSGIKTSKLEPFVLISDGELGPGAYRCTITVAGLSSIAVTLRTSALTPGILGITPALWLTYADGVTHKGSAGTGAGALSNAVRQTISLAGIKGEKYAVLEFTVPDDGLVTFDEAEVSGL